MSEMRPRTESELVERVRSIDVPAPETLRRDVRALVSRRAGAPGAGRRGFALGRLPALTLSVSAAVLAVVAVVAIALSSGGGAQPPLRQAADLTLRPATLAAPAQSTADPAQLAAHVGGVSFPYWDTRSLGWHATGVRHDRIGGHAVTTVFYGDGLGRRIGYAILAGASPAVGGGTVVWRGHTPYRLSVIHGVPVVTWLRAGHLCVLSGRGVDGATLLRLAGWGERSPTAS
jgi:hypothetical protein